MGKITGVLMTTVGIVISVLSGWYVVKGPFLGLATPPPPLLLAGACAFIGGVMVIGFGVGRLATAVSGDGRPVPKDKKT